MGKVIKLQVNDKEYVLEFNRKTILMATDIKDISSSYEKASELIRCAFLKNHPTITKQEVDNIIEEIDDLEKFLNAITKLIEDSVETLKEKKGNAHWEVN